MHDMTFDNDAECSVRFPVARGGDIGRTSFRLGMPHMNAAGVSMNWLLRESCHGHWWSLARTLGGTPSEFRDETGARVMASVVSCAVSGRLSAFAEDDLVSFRLATPPAAETGWLSETVLEARSGAYATVELVTAFAKRGGPSNRDLVRAEMPERIGRGGDGPAARRARLLRQMGRAARAIAIADDRPPHISCPVCPETHTNGVGLMYFANFTDCFARAERNALPPLVQEMSLLSREVHFFGNIDAGDTLDLLSDASVARLGTDSRVQTFSSARRRSDGTVIAVGLSTWGDG